MRVPVAQVRATTLRALQARGLAADLAEHVADVVAAAERDQCPSHGLFRVPGYCHALATGHVAGDARPVLVRARGAAVIVDGQGCFAPCAWALAAPHLAAAAREQGVAVAVLRRVHHFHALWYEVEALAAQGLVGLACVNSAAFVAHAPGGRERVYGTNPIAFGFPGPSPLVWDMATAAMARGEIQLHARAGTALPPGADVDAAGAPSTDPAAVLAGAQLPVGGAHKGSNLALMVELLAAGLTGSPFADEATLAPGTLPPGGAPTLHGEVVLALDPGELGAGDGPARAEAFLARVLGSGDGVRLPGERRIRARERAEDPDVDGELWATVQDLAGA